MQPFGVPRRQRGAPEVSLKRGAEASARTMLLPINSLGAASPGLCRRRHDLPIAKMGRIAIRGESDVLAIGALSSPASSR